VVRFAAGGAETEMARQPAGLSCHPFGSFCLIFEQRRGEIALACVGQHRDHGLARTELACQTLGRCNVRAR